VVGGFTIAPLSSRRAGAPVCVGYAAGSQNQAFGQSSSSSISGPNYSTGDCAQTIVPGTKDSVDALVESGFERSWHNNPGGLNVFSDPNAIASKPAPLHPRV